MSDPQHEIIFRGDIVLGHSISDVKSRLQQLFKVDAIKVDALFTGKPVALKRGLDLATAQKYKEALIKAGAQVEIQKVSGVSSAPAQPSASQTKPLVQAALQPKETSSASPEPAVNPATVWTLAPVGTYLLQAKERVPFVPRQIDTSALSLRPEGGNLLDAQERKAQPSVDVKTPNFQLAEVGALLIDAADKLPLPESEIELEDWTIADLGADLVSSAERKAPVIPPIQVPDLGLAPVGSNLGQIKPEVKAVTPDISGLSLAN